MPSPFSRRKATQTPGHRSPCRRRPSLEVLEDRCVPSTITGIKYHDLNANGARDAGEPGLPGWSIYLDLNRNGQRDSGEPSTLTNASGQYTFTGLAAGFYVVSEEQQSGWVQTTPAPISTPLANGGFENNSFANWQTIGNPSIRTASFGVTPTEGTYQALLTSGTGSATAGSLEAFLGLASGTLSGLGHGSATEGSALKRTFTAPAGAVLTFDWNFLTQEISPSFDDFAFVSLIPGGTSTLAGAVGGGMATAPTATGFTRMTGYRNFVTSLPTGGTYTLGVGVVDEQDFIVDSGLLLDRVRLLGGVHGVNLGPDQTISGRDFGNRSLLGEIRGSKWNDLNSNGLRDTGEPPLPGCTVYLDNNRNGQLDAGEPSTITDANGNYVFSNLPPGSYTVAQVLPFAWRQTSPITTGPEFRVNTFTSNTQKNPVIARNANGDFVIVWDSIGQDGSNGGVYAQRFNAVESGSAVRSRSTPLPSTTRAAQGLPWTRPATSLWCGSIGLRQRTLMCMHGGSTRRE